MNEMLVAVVNKTATLIIIVNLESVVSNPLDAGIDL